MSITDVTQMTKFEFSGPGLSIEQWDKINAVAVSLAPGQALWLSGYFAGLGQSARGRAVPLDALPAGGGAATALAAPAAPTRTLTILFGSETGNSAALAGTLADALRKQGHEPLVTDMADYKPRQLKDEQDLLVVTSTHGEGDPPQSAMAFFEFLEGHRAPKLPELRFAVLALGDSTYEHYCGAGKRIDARLEELGATRLAPRVDCDVDYDEPAAGFVAAITRRLEPAASPAAIVTGSGAPAHAAAPAPGAFDKRNPFQAAILDNIILTGRGSTKETRHIELSLEGSGLTYKPGDALGVMPQNDPALVDVLLERLALSADAPVTVKEQDTTLREAFTRAFEITAATPRFIEHWADITNARELHNLRGAENSEARAAFLRGHHVLDIVTRFPARGLDAQTFLAGLRPLQPRLYSIASSLAATPDEAHLTISTVRYELNGAPRAGVASGYFANQGAPETSVPVYIQPNARFHLPDDDDAPIIMIGAGTGVAPYRAFLQEREARGARGRSWLVFGERNFRSDFLYQTEWQAHLKNGVLSRMDVAFSRDPAPDAAARSATKTYVQHRLREHGRQIHAWLEDGAHLYVCGDGTHLAPDVQAALADIVAQHGRLKQDAANDYLATLQRDHRYQLDVY